jgi:hypothetical protein
MNIASRLLKSVVSLHSLCRFQSSGTEPGPDPEGYCHTLPFWRPPLGPTAIAKSDNAFVKIMKQWNRWKPSWSSLDDDIVFLTRKWRKICVWMLQVKLVIFLWRSFSFHFLNDHLCHFILKE